MRKLRESKQPGLELQVLLLKEEAESEEQDNTHLIDTKYYSCFSPNFILPIFIKFLRPQQMACLLGVQKEVFISLYPLIVQLFSEEEIQRGQIQNIIAEIFTAPPKKSQLMLHDIIQQMKSGFSYYSALRIMAVRYGETERLAKERKRLKRDYNYQKGVKLFWLIAICMLLIGGIWGMVDAFKDHNLNFRESTIAATALLCACCCCIPFCFSSKNESLERMIEDSSETNRIADSYLSFLAENKMLLLKKKIQRTVILDHNKQLYQQLRPFSRL